jgi:hypothetical protein
MRSMGTMLAAALTAAMLRAPTRHRYQLAVTGTAWAWAPAAAGASALWCLARRSSSSKLLSAVTTAACVSTHLAPTRPAVLRHGAPGHGGHPQQVSVASANLLIGNDHPLLPSCVASLDADVLVLAEVTDQLAARLEPLLGEPMAVGRNGAARVHLYTRLPAHRLPDLRVGPWAMPRIQIVDGPAVVGVHATNPAGKGALATWRRQLAALGELTGPIVLAGDFNTSVWHPEWNLVNATDAATIARHRPAPTWGPVIRGPRLLDLDHIAGRGVALSDFARHQVPGSDHDAVSAIVQCIDTMLPGTGCR